MDTTTLLIVFLLVSAATLASYALSHSSSMRSAIGLGWAASGIGTTLLLVAAAIVVLTFVFRGVLWQPDAPEQALRASPPASKEISSRDDVKSAPEAPSPAAATADQSARSVANQRAIQALAAFAGDEEQPQRKTAAAPGAAPSPPPSPPLPPTFSEASPWAARGCVLVFQPDLTEPTRWKVENGCEAPVAVLVSVCKRSPAECKDRNSSVWEYPAERILPTRAQRPVTHAEETERGQQVAYVACYVSSALKDLIGQPSEQREQTRWRQQFNDLGQNDACLTLIRQWLNQGRHAGRPIDSLVSRVSPLN